ncbi:MAG: NAAT family transporter [Calditrichae bacterium]|nr:NAAT family transporter [Calditrichia bacterium]
MSILSASILLFLVMDPFGNVPVFLSVLKEVPPQRRQKVIIRELFIALIVLLLFLLAGPHSLKTLQISEPSLRIAGGIILFLIAIKMVFGKLGDMFSPLEEEPFIVPLAIPWLAGPSAIATVTLLTGQEPHRWHEWVVSLLLAWILTSIILLLSARLDQVLGEKGMSALQQLMGLILTALAVEMFIQGLRTVFS